jgi:CRP-like cAMP-binding protein
MVPTVKGREIAQLKPLGEGSKFFGKIFQLFQNAPMFSKISTDEAKLVAGLMQVYGIRAGTAFIAEGDSGEFMVLLLEGEVAVIRDHQTPSARLIATAGPGKTLGEMSLIDSEPRFASCVAVSDTTFAVLSRKHLLQIIDEHPALGAKILMQLIVLLNQRLRAACAKLVFTLR